MNVMGRLALNLCLLFFPRIFHWPKPNDFEHMCFNTGPMAPIDPRRALKIFYENFFKSGVFLLITVLKLNVTILCIILMTPYNQIMPWDLNGLVCPSGTDVDLAQKCWVCPKLRPHKLIVYSTKGVSRAVQIEMMEKWIVTWHPVGYACQKN